MKYRLNFSQITASLNFMNLNVLELSIQGVIHSWVCWLVILTPKPEVVKIFKIKTGFVCDV